MAVQVRERSSTLGPPSLTNRPHLYVIDTDPHARHRHRRLIRRTRQAAEAAIWLAGGAGLIMLVLFGLAGLR